ncbi:MAG TPA: hypothetical protein VLA33_11930 [Gemmatimonadota bacterium]|nr:hypothetical protein [Gemmatimonadota bacterium]
MSARLPRSTPRALVALGLGVAVGLIALRGIVPAGAGVYYDDGIYLALAHALAEGEGYVYAHLPGAIPGVKYPPAYPAVLAAALQVLPGYPDNLTALKALNALFIGLAAALSFLVFVAAWDGRRSGGPSSTHGEAGVVLPDVSPEKPIARSVVLGVFAAATLLGYASAQTMTLATVLMSEPLWLVAVFGTLWLAGRRGTSPLLLGLVASTAFLTRSIGATLVAAVVLGELFARRPAIGGASGGRTGKLRRAGLVAFAAALPAAAWTAWSRAHAAEVPEPLAGQYGTYGHWFGAALGDDPFGRLPEIVAAHWTPLITNIEMLWVPNASALVAIVVLGALGVAVVVGLNKIARRNPALALFPLLYLPVVMVWPFEPDRFVYAILPTLTLFVATGGLVLAQQARRDLPRWGGILVGIVGGLLLFNTTAYEVKAHQNRAWTGFQATPAAVFEPLNEWIRDNTAPDAVVAAVLDPHVYWETGRRSVPNSQYRAPNLGSFDGMERTLAAEFDEILGVADVRWVAVVRGEGRAGATMAAFAAIHPERTRVVFEREVGAYTAQIYEVLPPGEAFPADEAGGG